MLDALGLALSGLTVCGDHAQLDRAVSAYGAARAVTRAPGAVRRSRCLLHQLGPGAGVEQLTALGRAASGG